MRRRFWERRTRRKIFSGQLRRRSRRLLRCAAESDLTCERAAETISRGLRCRAPTKRSLASRAREPDGAAPEPAFVGVEDPLARIVPVEIEPGCAIGGVPLHLRMIGGQILADILPLRLFLPTSAEW